MKKRKAEAKRKKKLAAEKAKNAKKKGKYGGYSASKPKP